MCYSAGSIIQSVDACPMCKVYSHVHRCPHVRETCRNRVAHPRMDVLYLANAEVDSFKGCGYCKWATHNPKSGYNNPGWPGCCRPPLTEEFDMIPPADWPAVSTVHAIPIPPAVGSFLNALLLPPNRKAIQQKSAIKSLNLPRGRQGSVTPRSNNPSRSSSATRFINESYARRKSSNPSQSSHSSPSRKFAQLENTVRRPALTPATTSVSISNVVVSDTRSSQIRHDSPTTPVIRRSQDSLAFSRPPKIDIDSRSSSSGSSDGMLSDSTITSEGFTDYLSDESEEELQRQAEARAAVVAQTQMEELEFKMARQQLARVGLEPPNSWTQTSSPPVSPTKNHSSRNQKISHSFAVAATAIMHTGQARG